MKTTFSNRNVKLAIVLAALIIINCIAVPISFFADASTYSMTIKGTVMYGLPEMQTAQDVYGYLGTAGVVKNASGATLSTTNTQYVGTGYTVQFSAGSTAYTIVVKGDANGDGRLNVTDYIIIKRCFAGTYLLSGAYLLAADADDDGTVAMNDYLSVKWHLSRKIDLFATASQGPSTSIDSSSSEESSGEESSDTSGETVDWESNTGTIHFNGSEIEVSGTGLSVSGKVVTVSSYGDFTVTGSTTDGMIHVFADTEDKVRLRLSGVSLANTDGPAIFFEQTKKSFVTLTDGTSSTLSDGTATTYLSKGTLFSNDTLQIEGNGTLNITGNYKHAVCSDDDIIVKKGVINVKNALVDAFHANDNITVTDGTITVSACGSDAFESESTVDINGGTVTVNATGDGVKALGTLTVAGGTLNVISADNALKGDVAVNVSGGTVNANCTGNGIKTDDTVVLSGGTVTITAGQDGIKASNSTDTTKGDVNINGGTLIITATEDGIQADANLFIDNASAPTTGSYNINIKSGGGSANYASITTTSASCKGIKGAASVVVKNCTMKIDACEDGIHSNASITLTGGNTTVSSGRDAVQATTDLTVSGGTYNLSAASTTSSSSGSGSSSNRPQRPGSSSSSTTTSTNSNKGLKGTTSLSISGGTITINTSDDCLHSNGNLTITGGTFTLASTSNDAVHADATLDISGTPTINITKSYEGLEGLNVNVKGGNISIVASDDGINAAGGADGSGGSFPGASGSSSSYAINISGSSTFVYVNAGGDGLDSNGSLTISGGTVLVDGPTGGGNSSIDADGTRLVNGGLLIAVGSKDMLENPSTSSSQCVLVVKFSSNKSAKTLFAVKNSSGKLLACYSPAKQYGAVTFSCSGLSQGSTYTICSGGSATGTATNGLFPTTATYTGGTTKSVTLSSKVTSYTFSG